MRTILSKSGHGILQTPAGAQALNKQLFAVQGLVKPLELSGLSLGLKHIHVDRGMYTPGTSVGFHFHQEIQIEYVLSGRFLFSGTTKQCRLAPGQGNIIFPDVRHAWRCEAGGAMIGILLEAVGPRHEKFLRARPAVNGQIMPVLKSRDIMLWTRQLFDLLAARATPWHCEQASGILELWLRAALAEALGLEAWLPPARTVGNPSRSHGLHICERALDFITANYSRPIHLRDIAGHVGVSGRHLNRLFHCHARSSINERLATLRLTKAWELLRKQPRCSVKEVAFASGFSSPAYFTQCFKKAYHRLPHEARVAPALR